MRSSLVDETRQDYLVTARAKGLMDKLVRRRHAVPNALLPTITLIFLNIGFVVSGAITVETVFSWPWPGPAELPGDPGSGRAVAAGHLPAVLARGRGRQHRGRRRGGRRRPAGAHVTTAPAVPMSARAVRRARRRAALGRFWASFRRERAGLVGLAVLAVFVLLALTAPLLFSPDQLKVTEATGDVLAPPTAGYPLGTDESGRSVLALVVWGTRVSLLVGVAATVISMAIGTFVGISSGHFRGVSGSVLERLTDWFLVIPFLPLAIVLSTVLGSSLVNVIVVIGVTSWPGTARLVRAQTLSVEARPYLERARVLGADTGTRCPATSCPT
jgi:ABC-type dipeptide/oligopeptide/nickel transport system permease subunit